MSSICFKIISLRGHGVSHVSISINALSLDNKNSVKEWFSEFLISEQNEKKLCSAIKKMYASLEDQVNLEGTYITRKKSTAIMILGPNGVGKTSLIELIQRHFDSDQTKLPSILINKKGGMKLVWDSEKRKEDFQKFLWRAVGELVFYGPMAWVFYRVLNLTLSRILSEYESRDFVSVYNVTYSDWKTDVYGNQFRTVDDLSQVNIEVSFFWEVGRIWGGGVKNAGLFQKDYYVGLLAFFGSAILTICTVLKEKIQSAGDICQMVDPQRIFYLSHSTRGDILGDYVAEPGIAEQHRYIMGGLVTTRHGIIGLENLDKDAKGVIDTLLTSGRLFACGKQGMALNYSGLLLTSGLNESDMSDRQKKSGRYDMLKLSCLFELNDANIEKLKRIICKQVDSFPASQGDRMELSSHLIEPLLKLIKIPGVELFVFDSAIKRVVTTAMFFASAYKMPIGNELLLQAWWLHIDDKIINQWAEATKSLEIKQGISRMKLAEWININNVSGNGYASDGAGGYVNLDAKDGEAGDSHIIEDGKLYAKGEDGVWVEKSEAEKQVYLGSLDTDSDTSVTSYGQIFDQAADGVWVDPASPSSGYVQKKGVKYWKGKNLSEGYQRHLNSINQLVRAFNSINKDVFIELNEEGERFTDNGFRLWSSIPKIEEILDLEKKDPFVLMIGREEVIIKLCYLADEYVYKMRYLNLNNKKKYIPESIVVILQDAFRADGLRSYGIGKSSLLENALHDYILLNYKKYNVKRPGIFVERTEEQAKVKYFLRNEFEGVSKKYDQSFLYKRAMLDYLPSFVFIVGLWLMKASAEVFRRFTYKELFVDYECPQVQEPNCLHLTVGSYTQYSDGVSPFNDNPEYANKEVAIQGLLGFITFNLMTFTTGFNMYRLYDIDRRFNDQRPFLLKSPGKYNDNVVQIEASIERKDLIGIYDFRQKLPQKRFQPSSNGYWKLVEGNWGSILIENGDEVPKESQRELASAVNRKAFKLADKKEVDFCSVIGITTNDSKKISSSINSVSNLTYSLSPTISVDESTYPLILCNIKKSIAEFKGLKWSDLALIRILKIMINIKKRQAIVLRYFIFNLVKSVNDIALLNEADTVQITHLNQFLKGDFLESSNTEWVRVLLKELHAGSSVEELVEKKEDEFFDAIEIAP